VTQRNGRGSTTSANTIFHNEIVEGYAIDVLGTVATAQVGRELAQQRRDVTKRAVPVGARGRRRSGGVRNTLVVLQCLQRHDERLVFVPTGRYDVAIDSRVALAQLVDPTTELGPLSLSREGRYGRPMQWRIGLYVLAWRRLGSRVEGAAQDVS